MCPCGSLKEDDPTALMLHAVHHALPHGHGHGLQGHWEALCAHRHGRRVVLHLLSPGSSRHVPASTQAFIHMPPKTVSQKVEAPDAEGAPAEVGTFSIWVTPIYCSPLSGAEHRTLKFVPQASSADCSCARAHSSGPGHAGVLMGPSRAKPWLLVVQTTLVTLGVSKKPEAVRQAELLLSSKPALLAHLCQVVGGALAAMLRAAGQCDIIVELCAGGSSGQNCHGAAVSAASRS